jgi:hypothetical protein
MTLYDLILSSNNTEMYKIKSSVKCQRRMLRLRKISELRGQANNESEVALYYKIGEARNIHNRAKFIWPP